MLGTNQTSANVVPGAGPAFVGYVDTTVAALRLIQAAVNGMIPRTCRRLTETERRGLINSGSVFIFSVAESGIRRWTDGMLWSPSRIQGNFLVYRELESKNPNRARKNATDERAPIASAGGEWLPTLDSLDLGGGASSSDPGTFKVNGLIKKTITITLRNSDFHLVSYYKREDISAGGLSTVLSRTDIMALQLSPADFQLDKLRNPPPAEKGQDGRLYIREITDDIGPECSPSRASTTLDSPEAIHLPETQVGFAQLPRLATMQLETGSLSGGGSHRHTASRSDTRNTSQMVPRRHTFSDVHQHNLSLPPLDVSQSRHSSLPAAGHTQGHGPTAPHPRSSWSFPAPSASSRYQNRYSHRLAGTMRFDARHLAGPGQIASEQQQRRQPSPAQELEILGAESQAQWQNNNDNPRYISAQEPAAHLQAQQRRFSDDVAAALSAESRNRRRASFQHRSEPLQSSYTTESHLSRRSTLLPDADVGLASSSMHYRGEPPISPGYSPSRSEPYQHLQQWGGVPTSAAVASASGSSSETLTTPASVDPSSEAFVESQAPAVYYPSPSTYQQRSATSRDYSYYRASGSGLNE